MENSKKSILVIDPNSKMSGVLIKELKKLNYITYSIFPQKMESYQYTSLIDKFKNIFNRLVLRNKKYYHTLINNFYKKYTLKLLDQHLTKFKRVDYILVIKGHGFSKKFYKRLNKISNNICIYEYDGLDDERLMSLKKIQNLVNKTFVFDPKDTIKLSNSIFISNYHNNAPILKNKNLYDLYYLGTDSESRQKKLYNLFSSVPNFKSKYLVITNKPIFNSSGIIYRETPILYEEYLKDIQNTKAIVDIKMTKHDGLSFRFFEALNLEKKIITNNHQVQYYNFYHPDNIYITDFETFDGLSEFLQKPYHPISPDIVKMYGLDNWIKNIFEIDDYIPIPMPNIPNQCK